MKPLKLLILLSSALMVIACSSPEKEAKKLVQSYSNDLSCYSQLKTYKELDSLKAKADKAMEISQAAVEMKFEKSPKKLEAFHSAITSSMDVSHEVCSFKVAFEDALKKYQTPDLAVFDLRGPVKTVKYSNYELNYDQDGNLEKVLKNGKKFPIKRDKGGYIERIGYDRDFLWIGIAYIAWGNGKPAKYRVEVPPSSAYGYYASPKYDENGMITSFARQKFDFGGSGLMGITHIQVTYTDDEFGNHITSSHALGAWSFGKERTITYWE